MVIMANNNESTWAKAQEGERDWWGKCINTYFEEEKQLKYAAKMGLKRTPNNQTPYEYDMEGKKVLDIGGGPISMLLKCKNVQGTVIDPLEFPAWVKARYDEAGIEYRQGKGEDIDVTGFDEVWIYNVLQHADNPERIVKNARNAGKLVRIFEWVDTPPNTMHPNKLDADQLNTWLGGTGKVETTEGGRFPAKMYYGVSEGQSQMGVHFVTTGPKFSYIYYLGIMTALKAYGDKVILWYTEEPKSVYFEMLRDKVTMKKVDNVPDFPALKNIDDHLRRVSVFDYVVWQSVYKHGGIIMGLDSLTLRSHFDLLSSDKEILAPIDAPGTTYFGMHGVIVRKGSPLAKDIIADAITSLNDTSKPLKWGDAGMTPYVHRSRVNLDKLSQAPFQTVCGRHPDLFTEGADMPHSEVRTIALYSSSSRVADVDAAYIQNSQSPYANIVKSLLTKKEWMPTPAPTKADCYQTADGWPSVVEDEDCIGSGIVGLEGISLSTVPCERHKVFHLLGLSHVAANKREGLACAFSQKVVKMGQMLKSLGHTVYFYGVEGSEVECDEFIQVSTQDILKQTYGDYDMKKVTYKHAQGDLAYQTFNENTITEIKKRMTPNDFLLIPFSPQRYNLILDALDTKFIDKTDKLNLTVEMGIGYRGTMCKYKVFESVSQMHFNYGLANAHNNGATLNGNRYDCVIPNYFDPNDFEYSDSKKDYFLYLGRVTSRKGVSDAIKTVEAIGAKLIIAGQLGDGRVDMNSPNVEYVGFADVQKRKELLRDAKGLFLPTWYIEPFGGVIIEAALSGTPVITSDYGAFPELVLHGETGYRCHTLDHYVFAANNIGNIKPVDCYNYAMANFSMDRVRWMYEEYFNMLLDYKENVNGEGWHRLHPERTQLDWLNKVRNYG